MHRAVSTVLIAAAGLGVIVTLAVFARDYGVAPQIVPTHFGGSGDPNAWGPKSTFVIFPVIVVVVFALVTIVSTVGLPSRNVPVPSALPILTGAVFVELIWILAFAEIGSFAVALGRATELNSTIMWVGLTAVMLTAAFIVVVALIAAARARST